MSMVNVERQGGLAVLTIDKPPLNPLSSDLLTELEGAIDNLTAAGDCGALIITGGGDKAFVAGADITEFPNLNKDNGEKLARRGQLIFQKIADFPAPVIAAVNGFALGGGMELALCCDIRVVSDNAKLGLPEVTLGIFPGYGGTQRLPRIISLGKAMELIFTGDMIDAAEAGRIGIADHVVPAGTALDEAKKIAGRILSRGPIAVRQAKKAVIQGLETTLAKGMEIEASLFAAVCETEDQKEGAQAFIEKRKPEFKGK